MDVANVTAGIAGRVRPVETILVLIDEQPWAALYRTGIGFGLLPAAAAVFGSTVSGSQVAIFLGAVLIGLRVVPMVLRRALPIPRSVRSVWTERRQLAVRYDSYQWQKLFWIGLGMCGYMVGTNRFSLVPGLIALFCLVAGIAGFVVWRFRRAQLPTAPRVPQS
jgi:hypothetical protein